MKYAYIFAIMLLFAVPAFAHCPACTFATGAAVATARFYGFNDLAVGTFLGAFILSSALWFNNLLLKRNRRKTYVPFQAFLLPAIVFVLSIAGLWEIVRTSSNVFGFNRMLLGILTGTFVSLIAYEFHKALRGYNSNRNYLPLQVILVTLVFLLVINLGFYSLGWF